MTTSSDIVATSPAHLMELFAERAAAGDIDGLMDLYESEAVLQPEFGVSVTGHEQIRSASAQFLALNPKIIFSSDPDVVIAGDIALVSNFWTMTATAPDGSTVSDGGTSADIVRRQGNGSWRILIDQPRGESTTP